MLGNLPKYARDAKALLDFFNTAQRTAPAIAKVAGSAANAADAGKAAENFAKAGGEVVGKGKDWLKNLMSGYWETMAEGPARSVYESLTDIEAGRLNRGLRSETSPKFYTSSGSKSADPPTFKTTGLQKNLRPVDDFLNPAQPGPEGQTFTTPVVEFDYPGAKGKRYAARVSKGTSSSYGADTGVDPVPPEGGKWAQVLYDNPEFTAKAVGTTIGIGTPLAAGAFLHHFAQGGKPRSAYAAPVTPTRGGYDSTYNPSVESARAAAQYRHDLEEQKFRHKMDLMNARQEARTPGSQGGGYSVGSMLDKVYGGRSTSYL
jgi:hypothetical protein